MKRLLFLLLVIISLTSTAQQIVYSVPDRYDMRNAEYHIVGKMSNGNIIIYKTSRNEHFFYVYNNEMKLSNSVQLTSFNNKILSADFIQYPDYFYMVYQYQDRGVFYCKATKFGIDGKMIDDPKTLDTTNINYNSTGKIYTILNSEDKSKIVLFKISARNENAQVVTSVLFDKNMEQIHKTKSFVPLTDKNEFLTEFQVDNDGNLAFIKAAGSSNNDNISKLVLCIKPPTKDSLIVYDTRIVNIYLDDIRLKIDNHNNHYVITSFYSNQRRSNIQGLYVFFWDKNSSQEMLSNTILFTDELRDDAKGSSSKKAAFNNYFLRNTIMLEDGGFIIGAESLYTSSRGNYLNRWDYYGGYYPYGFGYSPFGFYNNYYSPFYGGYGSPYGMYNNYNYNRYYADNILVLSINSNGKISWSNVIHKEQYDDITDLYLGYGLINTGDQLHFLFNAAERRQTLFTDHTISPEGQLNAPQPFKGLDKDYQFIPRQAKQTGATQFIVPCTYRSYICFAKVEF